MTARQAAIVVAVAIGTLTLIQSANADALGIPPRLEAWLPILTGGLGIVASFLPAVQRGAAPADPPAPPAEPEDEWSPDARRRA